VVFPRLPWEIPALEVGATALWHSTAAEVDRHVIEVVDPPRRFALRWEPAPPDTPRTTTYALAEENGGTRVTVSETGFELVPADLRREQMEGTAEGYRLALENLQAYLEGRSLPH
jgi:uncharacterized protein YndB with AHSA1/START domain